MNKKEFILKIKEQLIGMDQSEKREILLDYEEHFLDGKNMGRSEEEICDSLGDPKEIAKSLLEAKKDSEVKASNNTANIIGLIALTLGCLWLINIIFGVIGGSVGGVIGIIALLTLPLGIWIKVTSISAIIFTLALLVLIGFGLVKLIIMICRWYQSLLNGLDNREPSTREFKMFKPKAAVWILTTSICVLSLMVMIFGGITIATEFAYDFQNGKYDDLIERIDERVDHIDEDMDEYEALAILLDKNIEDLKDLDSHNDLEELKALLDILTD